MFKPFRIRRGGAYLHILLGGVLKVTNFCTWFANKGESGLLVFPLSPVGEEDAEEASATVKRHLQASK